MERVTVRTLRKKKKEGRKITMISTYDFISARLCEEVGIDSVLVGDSLGMVFQGQESTLPVTVEEIIYHTKAVKRGAPTRFIIVDMPFMSYQTSVEDGLRNCGRVIKETGAQAVKLEGGEEIAHLVRRLVETGIPVVGHIGYTPQSEHRFGGPKVVGKEPEEVEKLKRDLKILEDAGVFMVVLESIPWKVAKDLSESSSVITVGIGAGKYCDGQVLVFHDLVGLVDYVKPKFVRRYAEGAKIFREALRNFKIDVERGDFPSEGESYGE